MLFALPTALVSPVTQIKITLHTRGVLSKKERHQINPMNRRLFLTSSVVSAICAMHHEGIRLQIFEQSEDRSLELLVPAPRQPWLGNAVI
jgi:hypothetical protein